MSVYKFVEQVTLFLWHGWQWHCYFCKHWS